MIKTIQYTILSLFLGILIGVFTFGFFHPGFFANLKQARFFIVTSGSMEPAIGVGSAIFIIPQSSYADKDVITFMPEGSPKTIITHRVISRPSVLGAKTYQTAGDANNSPDSWQLPPENILGKVVITAPKVGYFVNFAKQPSGFILLVIVPATIFIYEELKTIFKELKKVKAQNNLPFNKRWSKKLIFAPALAAAVIIVGYSGAQLFDKEKSIGNIFSAAANFSSPAPLVSPLSKESLLEEESTSSGLEN